MDPKVPRVPFRVTLNADLILDIDGHQYLVNSEIVCSASPVWKARLETQYPGSLKDCKSCTDPIALLPEDDRINPKALQFFLRLLHKFPSETMLMPDAPMVADVATICTKYDCVASLKEHSPKWFDRDFSKVEDVDCSILLVSAYALDIPKAFQKLSIEILSFDHNFPARAYNLYYLECDDYPLIARSFSAKLISLRAYHNRRVYFALEAGSELCHSGGDCANNGRRRAECRAMMSEKHISIVAAAELRWLPRLSHIRQSVRDWVNFPVPACGESQCPCSDEDAVGNKVLAELEDLEDYGLCLDCERTGNRSKAEGTCRLPHKGNDDLGPFMANDLGGWTQDR